MSFQRPFSPTSFARRPIGKGAQYAAAGVDASNCNSDIFDFVQESANNPEWKLYDNRWNWDNRMTGSDTGIRLRLPANFKVYTQASNPGANAGVVVFNQDGSRIRELSPTAANSGSKIKIIYSGVGDFPPAAQGLDANGDAMNGGHGGSGITLALALRSGDLTRQGGVGHPLAINLWGAKFYNRDCKPRWPANRVDSYAQGNYKGTNSNLRPGSLLAIPPSITAQQAGVKTPKGVALFEALRLYGAYCTDDSAWDSADFACDVVVSKDFDSIPLAEKRAMLKLLNVISNNESGGTTSGGGDPLTGAAPPPVTPPVTPPPVTPPVTPPPVTPPPVTPPAVKSPFPISTDWVTSITTTKGADGKSYKVTTLSVTKIEPA